MKNHVKLFGIIVMLLVVLAGCSGTEEAPSATTEPTTVSETAEPTTVEVTTEGKSENEGLKGMALIESLDYKMEIGRAHV